ncbi:DinB family protein [Planctomonas deserti]|uniref:DinB family protein n=1 Tax=Planctomonas deserti TaxID=2144185 RepID=UPI00131F3822|nr:DinB family protein [Planctomonas deserti]
MSLAAEVLLLEWEASAQRLDERCRGLTDAEYLWCPVPGCWNVEPDPEGSGRWTYPYEFAPAPTAPLTTIAWRLVHVTAGNWIYWEHAFGPGTRTFPDLDVPSTARAALADWRSSRAPVTRWLSGADDSALLQPRPSHLGDPLPAVEVVRILIDEQVHHGAEVALLRDLYLRRDELRGPGVKKDQPER